MDNHTIEDILREFDLPTADEQWDNESAYDDGADHESEQPYQY